MISEITRGRIDRRFEKQRVLGHSPDASALRLGVNEDGRLINPVSSEAANGALPPPTDLMSGAGSLVQIAMTSLDDAKAEETILIDLNGKTSIADAMIVTTGRSSTHVGAIAERVLRAIKEAGFGVPRIEGLVGGDWVLIDAGDIIVHVFRAEVRQFYNLEKMWGNDRPRPA